VSQTKKFQLISGVLTQTTQTTNIKYVGTSGSNVDYVCTGTNDDVVINSAISDIGGSGGTVFLLPGTYSISNPITLTNNVNLQGSGPEATIISVATNFSYNTSKWCIGAAGTSTTGTAMTLSSNTSQGSQSLSITTTGSSGTELANLVNDGYTHAFLRSEGLWESLSGFTTKLGEFVKILLVETSSGTPTGTVDLWGMTRSAYLTTDTASLYRISFVSDISILDLSITQATTIGTVSTTQASVTPFISLQLVKRAKISNCRLHDGDGPGITLYHCLDVLVDNNNVNNLTDNSPNKYLGYGCLIGGASERCVIRGNKFDSVRHGVDAGTSLSSLSFTSNYGVARGILVVDNTVEHATNACFSTHGPAENWEFTGNLASNSLSYGMFMRARGSRLIGNTIQWCSGGIGVGDTSYNTSGGSASGSHIISNTIRNIKTQTITTALQNIGISSSGYSQGEGIILGLTDNTVVADNTISDCDGAGIRLRLSAIRNQIINNTIVDVNLANTSNTSGIIFDGNYNGTTASLSQSGSTTTLTGGSGFASTIVGRTIVISNSASNNGTYTVASFISSSSLTYINAGGATDSSGSVHYYIEGSTDNYIANNTVINRAASSFDVNTTGNSKYIVYDPGVSGNTRNIYKNNTGINMSTGLISSTAAITYTAGNDPAEGLSSKTNAGAITDSLFLVAPSDGTYGADTTDKFGYLRLSGTWYSIPTSGAPTWDWENSISSPTIKQLNNTTSSGTGQALTIQAQNATGGGSSVGGLISLASGSGALANGVIQFQPGGTTKLTISALGDQIQWDTGVVSPTIKQNDNITNSATATNLTIQSQNATGTTATGGNLTLNTGTGTTNPGNLILEIGGTTLLTLFNTSGNPTTLQWGGTITAPSINQGATSSGNGATFTIQAQNTTQASGNPTGGALTLKGGQSTGASGGTNTGGSINLSTGTVSNGSVNTAGSINFQAAGTTFFTYVSPSATGTVNAQFVAGITAVNILQASTSVSSAVGAALTLQAQNATGTTATGGQLKLTSGTGTTAAGSVVLQTGGTTRLTANATGVITIANLGTGLVHSDSSGNLTSSTLVNADVSATAAIAYSKLGGTGTETLNPQEFDSNINAKGTERNVLPKNVQTTDATVTTLDSFTLASNTAVLWTSMVTAIRSDNAAAAGYQISGVFRNTSGTVSQIGSIQFTSIGADDATWTATMNFTGTTIRLQVTGKAATTIQWTCITTRLEVIS